MRSFLKQPKYPKGEYLYGPHTVYAALKYRKRPNYHHLYAIESSECNEEHKHHKIIQLCESMRVPITYFSKGELVDLISLHRHNGFVLDADCIQCDSLESNPIAFGKVFSSAQRNDSNMCNTQVWIGMEQARNQDNVGSILRSCLYFGINGVLYSTLSSCPLSPIVARTSCGALDAMEIRLCQHKPLNEYLIDIKRSLHLMDANVKIIGLDMFEHDKYFKHNKRVNVRDVDRNLLSFKNNVNNLVILVIGNEGFGLTTEIKQECDYLAFIEKGQDAPDYFDSISVNVAASIALHQLVSNLKP